MPLIVHFAVHNDLGFIQRIKLCRAAFDNSTLLRGFEVGLTLSFFSIAVMYPLVLKFGTEKNELILILSTFGAIGMQLLTAACLAQWTDGMNMRHPLVEAVSTLVAIIVFFASYFVSVKIHKGKEF